MVANAASVITRSVFFVVVTVAVMNKAPYLFPIFKVETFHPSGGREVVKLLIGNKIDLENRKVSRNEGEEWARSKV